MVQREAHLLELTRYVVLNPVRANLVQQPEEWPWSSYPCFVGTTVSPPWLDTTSTLMKFGTEPVAAQEAYRNFVAAGIGLPSPLLNIKHQLILGDENYVQQVQQLAQQRAYRAIIKTQRRILALSLKEYACQFSNPNEAMAEAYYSTVYTMDEIGAHFGVSSKTVSRAIKKYKPG